MNKHRAQRQRWHRGSLRTTYHEFDNIEEAIVFANSGDPGTIKVYNGDNELVHHNAITEETYA